MQLGAQAHIAICYEEALISISMAQWLNYESDMAMNPEATVQVVKDWHETFYFEEAHVHAAGAWVWTYSRLSSRD